MAFKDSTLAKYIKNIKSSPRPLISNKNLILTSLVYAAAGIPLCWDQGSVSTITSLPGFQHAFGISSATNPKQVSDFISLVYVGASVGAASTYFVNDVWGRLWAFRFYGLIWIIGQLMAVASSGNIGAMYAARIIAGLGIGPMTVIGPVALSEVAPAEIRGLITSWFSVIMLLTLTTAAFTVFGCFHMAASSLQWRIPFFAPTIVMALVIVASFFILESPRWLFLVDRNEEAIEVLVKLRGLPLEHPRVQSEVEEIKKSIIKEREASGSAKPGSFAALRGVCKEMFLVKANLRRTQQGMVSYALAQLSGANSITTYLVPVLSLIGVKGGTTNSLLYAGLYSMAKFFYTLIASFFFVDALGRRNSLFIGITVQMISHIYISVFIKFNQTTGTSHAAGQAALAAIFLHGFGYAVGLLILPYVFVSELWPNQLRSFGAAITQCFHWIFFFGVNKGVPSLLASTHNWGAFLFFAGWCFLALLYTFFTVPETAGLDMERIDELFEGPWWNQYKRAKTMTRDPAILEATDSNAIGAESGKVTDHVKV
ncbi:putative mfs quinate transporter protein [Phaeoacremonium minimum UCRPA7]|uniref:Putative mfs quinate transporter protein n=1 Tax=Phaeoacremonium minimum (strain UCR-PA7) TaxID=1286976 RepID=R8BVA5_PHAM7|nr:putative mfs quinate transporter protein [Phaeoacremonium minimum UCRPA7]EOO03287.1 putative mfs quinate transporter protein [Phaeoacremonium minimum UCRPA7]